MKNKILKVLKIFGIAFAFLGILTLISIPYIMETKNAYEAMKRPRISLLRRITKKHWKNLKKQKRKISKIIYRL